MRVAGLKILEASENPLPTPVLPGSGSKGSRIDAASCSVTNLRPTGHPCGNQANITENLIARQDRLLRFYWHLIARQDGLLREAYEFLLEPVLTGDSLLILEAGD